MTDESTEADGGEFTSDETPPPNKSVPVVKTERPPSRESTRRWLALGLLLLLASFAIIGEIAFIKDALTAEEFKELTLFFSPIVGLAGAAFGFFFGESKR